jgi:hypothetical protein
VGTAVVVERLPVVDGDPAAVVTVVGAALAAVVVGDADECFLLPQPVAITAKPTAAMQSFEVLDGLMGINLATPVAAIREPAAQPNRSFPGCIGR